MAQFHGKVREKSGEEKTLTTEKPLSACAICQHQELYRKKDFPRALGLSIIGAAIVLTLWQENYIFLFAAAAIDALLFWIIKEVYVCYQCGAEHRGIPFDPRPCIFDIAIADRHRFGAAYKGPRSTND